MRQRSWARGATLSRDGQWLAVSEIGLALHVFDTRSGARRTTLQPQWLEAFYHLDFSPDGDRLAAGNGEGTVAVWEVETGRLLVGLPRQGPDVNLAWQGSRLITTDGEANIRIWDGLSGTLIRAWKRSAPVWFLAVSPDWRRVVTDSARVSVVGYDSALCEIWDAQTGSSLLTLREHAEPLNAMTFSADGLSSPPRRSI
ncbi:MAG: WD40 repeat domain-containing protein [Verrucomicrobia bacterium]|nr:WD40 repeat domain-containing protein [Verrucomicrobiota bacterium]